MDKINCKVYIITKGAYSDYHICAVTLDKKHAENLKRLLTDRYDEAYIEEYIIDETKENGSVYEIEFYTDKPQKVCIDEYDGWGKGNKTPIIQDWHTDCVLKVIVRAKDEKHAIKIAQDEYAKWKTQKEGIL